VESGSPEPLHSRNGQPAVDRGSGAALPGDPENRKASQAEPTLLPHRVTSRPAAFDYTPPRSLRMISAIARSRKPGNCLSRCLGSPARGVSLSVQEHFGQAGGMLGNSKDFVSGLWPRYRHRYCRQRPRLHDSCHASTYVPKPPTCDRRGACRSVSACKGAPIMRLRKPSSGIMHSPCRVTLFGARPTARRPMPNGIRSLARKDLRLLR